MGDQKETPPAPPPAFRIEGDRAVLFGALVKARAGFKPLENNQTGDVVKDGKRLYSYDYADLANVQEATAPALAANGLMIMQPWWSDGEGYVSSTILAHVSGALMATETWFKSPGAWQQVGSALSYIQRYQWRSILGISASKDDDDGASTNNGAGNGASALAPARQATRAPQTTTRPAATQHGTVTEAQLHDIVELAEDLHWDGITGANFMKAAIGFSCKLEALNEPDARKLIAAMVAEQTKQAAAS